MKKAIALACTAIFTTASFAYADSVTIRETDPDTTGSVIVKERQDPDLIIKQKRKKVIIKEDTDPDVTIRGTVDVE